MRNRPTARNVTPPLGLPLSLALHLCVIAVSLFSWSHTLDITDQTTPVVPVELVTLADKTNIAPMHTEEPQKSEEPQEAPQPTPTPAPPSKAEPAPTPPDVHAAPRPKAPEPAPAPTPAPKAQPRPTPPTPPAPQKATGFNLDSISALVDKRQKSSSAWKAGKVGTQNIKGYGMQDAMTADLRALLQSEIYKCWSPPVGSPHPEQLIVQFRLHLNRDGSVARAPDLADTALPPNNPYMRAAIEAARRAIYTCAPYKLPTNRYNQWQDLIFNFDPRAMMAQ